MGGVLTTEPTAFQPGVVVMAPAPAPQPQATRPAPRSEDQGQPIPSEYDISTPSALTNALVIQASPFIDSAVQAITLGQDVTQAVENAWTRMRQTLGRDFLANLVASAFMSSLKWTEWKQVKPSSVEENVQRGQEAIQTALGSHENILNAMSRDDLGSVSFYWGTPGRGEKFKHGEGLAHIDAKHGRNVLEMMPEVIAKGKIIEHQFFGQQGERVKIGYQGHTAVLSLWKMGEKETWLLTGWDDYPVPGPEGDSERGR